MERRFTLLQKMLTIPMAAVAVAELFYLRWTMADGAATAVPARAEEKPQTFTVTGLPRAAAA